MDIQQIDATTFKVPKPLPPPPVQEYDTITYQSLVSQLALLRSKLAGSTSGINARVLSLQKQITDAQNELVNEQKEIDRIQAILDALIAKYPDVVPPVVPPKI